MARGERFHFYRLSASQGRWMHLVMESQGVTGDDGTEVTEVVEAYWVDTPDPAAPAQPLPVAEPALPKQS